MLGRTAEQDMLNDRLFSRRPELVVISGRYRVGKTYLVEQFFQSRFSFHVVGEAAANKSAQLKLFHRELVLRGDASKAVPRTWSEAFERLREVLRQKDAYRNPESGRRVVFFDEMPWFDTPRSDFRAAFELFWNSWGAFQHDLMLIVCGSDGAWLMRNLPDEDDAKTGRQSPSFGGDGGLRLGVSCRIELQPFTLAESETLLRYNGLELTRLQVLELYMAFGGVPYYLCSTRRGRTPAQEIERLCFLRGGPLEDEFNTMLRSLFRNHEVHKNVLRMLAKQKRGYTASEVQFQMKRLSGASVAMILENLEQCGLVMSTKDYQKAERGRLYRVCDPFALLCLKFLDRPILDSWSRRTSAAGYDAWRRATFESVCLMHINKIQFALGISGVETSICAWTSQYGRHAPRVDILLDRGDGIVDICETSYGEASYGFGRSEFSTAIRRRAIVREAIESRKTVHLVLIAAGVTLRDDYAAAFQSVLTEDALFV